MFAVWWGVGAAAVVLAALAPIIEVAPLALLAAAFFMGRPAAARAEEADTAETLAPDARAILDAAPDACIILGGDGTVLWANRAAVEQFGAFTVGAPFSFVLRVPELVRAVEKVARAGLSERVRWSEKVPTSRWFEAFISPFALSASTSGGAKALAIFVHDLTEQKRLDQMREDFVANASHELRTPLAALTGFIETLQGPARDDAKARGEFLSIMRDQADRMRRLIDALLSLSRVEMRAHVRPTTVVDLAKTTRYAVEMSRSLAEENRVTLEVSGGDAPLPVRGDADELLQVIHNLLENAIKYGGGGGRVLVTVRKEAAEAGDIAAVAVQDFGRGIAPEHVPRLTERFYRVDVEESRAREGTGLGLAIVKHIVTRHKGRFIVRSELGAGSTFVMKIPVQSAPVLE